MERQPMLNLTRMLPNCPKPSAPRRPVVRQIAGGRNRRSSGIVDSILPSVPQSFKMYFRPTLGMGLSTEETKLAAYIFSRKEEDPAVHLGEVLYELAGFEVVRGIFISLAPPYTPHPDVINTTAMIASLTSAKSMAPVTWYFPSDFARDVLCDAPISKLKKSYEGRWMQETNALEHVFVPILEAADSWYIMLLNIKEAKKYVLDVSRTPESIVRREANMNKICVVLGKMFVHNRNIMNFLHASPDPSNWGDYLYPEGLPNNLDSPESGIWCLSWLQHKGGFSPNIFNHMENSDHVRMKTALHIVQSETNQLCGYVSTKADMVWCGITSTND
ncbi:hypothetical protein S83_008762 [Arachis hypogaea]